LEERSCHPIAGSTEGVRRLTMSLFDDELVSLLPTIEEAIEEFDSEPGLEELNRFRNKVKMPTLREAIRVAAASLKPNGHPYQHQQKSYNFRRPQTEAAIAILSDADTKPFRKFTTFEAIHAHIAALLDDLVGNGIGPLYLYDVAFRIGAYLNILPLKVYLHAGALDGANRLVSKMKTRKGYLEVHELPPALRRLPAWQVEDFFCDYEKQCRHAEGSKRR
jgi:hypothetical protein